MCSRVDLPSVSPPSLIECIHSPLPPSLPRAMHYCCTAKFEENKNKGTDGRTPMALKRDQKVSISVDKEEGGGHVSYMGECVCVR